MDNKDDGLFYDSIYLYYHENGQLIDKGNYKDGLMHGLWEEYDENGTLKKTEIWEMGELINCKGNYC